jgi:hypothetical protein
MQSDSISSSLASFPRLRTPGVVLLARDLRSLIVLLGSLLRRR